MASLAFRYIQCAHVFFSLHQNLYPSSSSPPAMKSQAEQRQRRTVTLVLTAPPPCACGVASPRSVLALGRGEIVVSMQEHYTWDFPKCQAIRGVLGKKLEI